MNNRRATLVLLAAACGGLFCLLWWAVSGHAPGFPLDRAAARLLDHRTASGRPAGLGRLARLGAKEVMVPLVVVGAVLLTFVRRSLWPPVLIVGSYLGAASVTHTLKIDLHRPEPHDLAGELGRSFPSGHAAQAAVVYAMLAALVAFTLTAPRARRAVWTVAAALIVVVNLAVLWNGAHWFSDQVGGTSLGLAWVAACLALVPDRSLGPPFLRRGPWWPPSALLRDWLDRVRLRPVPLPDGDPGTVVRPGAPPAPPPPGAPRVERRGAAAPSGPPPAAAAPRRSPG